MDLENRMRQVIDGNSALGYRSVTVRLALQQGIVVPESRVMNAMCQMDPVAVAMRCVLSPKTVVNYY